LPAIAVAVDTSGSIGQTVLDSFAAEVSAILGEYDTTIRLLCVDSRVQAEATFTRPDLPLRLEPRGGGGTDFRPAFDRLAEGGEAPAALIYLTDLCGRFPEQEPEYPTLWVCTTDREAPFGETVALRADR
jgi:predicted metal-dependent peptidase